MAEPETTPPTRSASPWVVVLAGTLGLLALVFGLIAIGGSAGFGTGLIAGPVLFVATVYVSHVRTQRSTPADEES